MTETTKPKVKRGHRPRLNPERPLTSAERTARNKERIRRLVITRLEEARATRKFLASLAQKAEATNDIEEARAVAKEAFLAAGRMLEDLEQGWNSRLQIEGSSPVTIGA